MDKNKNLALYGIIGAVLYAAAIHSLRFTSGQ